MKHYDDHQKIMRWNWDYGCRRDLIDSDTEKLSELVGKLKRMEKKERADIKKIYLRATIAAVVFMILIASYKLASKQHDLAYDLTAAFSKYAHASLAGESR